METNLYPQKEDIKLNYAGPMLILVKNANQ